MSVNKAKTPTKDGKCWFFRVPYRDEFNTIKQYNSTEQQPTSDGTFFWKKNII